MAKHNLSLEIPMTLNECQMIISDTSMYSDGCINVTCPQLQITAPGFICATTITEPDISAGFCNLVLNACDLELQSENCETILNSLPDGVYVIRYSVSPNEYVYVEYNHMRVTQLMKSYYNAMCEIKGCCDKPTKETNKLLRELADVKMYIEAAVAKVEFCHEPDSGMKLYTYAKNLLSKITCTDLC